MKCCEYNPRDIIHKTSFSLQLTNGTNNLSLEKPFQLNVTLKLIGPIHNLRKKCCEYSPRGQIHTKLHFPCNSQMGPISQSVYLSRAFLAQCDETLQLIGPIHNLRKKCCEYSPRGIIHKTSFSLQLTNRHNKLECLSLESLFSLV